MAVRESKYKTDLPDKLIEHMKKGLSFESFSAVAGVTRDALYKWCELHPDFKLAKSLGEGHSKMFWETVGIQGTLGKINNFSATIWIFTMKCRFGYRDGSETGNQADTKETVVYKSSWGSGNLALVQSTDTEQ